MPAYIDTANAPTYAILMTGSEVSPACRMRDSYWKGSATFYNMEIGSLKYTGTQNLVKSLPMESFRILKKLMVDLGLKAGRFSRSFTL